MSKYGGRQRLKCRVAITVAISVGLCVSAATAAEASTGLVPDAGRASAVQAVLDRIVGPGNSIVEIADTVQTSATTRIAVTWGSPTADQVVWSKQVTADGTSSGMTRQNAVGNMQTVTTSPTGTLVRQSVSVAIDRRYLGSTSLPRIRHLVAAAAGVVGGRGDRVFILVTRFAARPALAPAKSLSIWGVLVADPLPVGLSALGAFLLLATVGRRIVRRRLRRRAAA